MIFVDTEAGSLSRVTVPSGITSGLRWLDARSLVLNQSSQLGGPGQLFRLAYPDGSLSRLTNDPNDYMGASLSGAGSEIVTVRRDARMDVWIGDRGGIAGTEVVRRAPVSVERLAWSGRQLLYGTVVGGRPVILRVTPGEDTAEEVVLDALTPGATRDGQTIVFVSSFDNNLELWKAEANGRRIARLAPGVTAEQVVITPNQRAVIFTALTGGSVSIWMVPIDGDGTPTKLADGRVASVSPDGGSMAFPDRQASLIVCALPGCTSPRTIGSMRFEAPLAWTPDGLGVAYASDSNVWVQPLAGGAPRQLTRFAGGRPIGSFAWSGDGERLAVTRSTETYDIVLLSGVK